MRAELKYIHSPDVELDTYYPEDPSCFSIYIQAMIGPEGEESEESFGMEVCTPKWLGSNDSSNVIFGKNLVIMNEYNMPLLQKTLADKCEKCLAESWEDIRNKLSSLGESEFANYQPYKG